MKISDASCYKEHVAQAVCASQKKDDLMLENIDELAQRIQEESRTSPVSAFDQVVPTAFSMEPADALRKSLRQQKWHGAAIDLGARY